MPRPIEKSPAPAYSNVSRAEPASSNLRNLCVLALAASGQACAETLRAPVPAATPALQPPRTTTAAAPAHHRHLLSEPYRWGAGSWLGYESGAKKSPLHVFTPENVPTKHFLANVPRVPNGLWVGKSHGHFAVRDEASFPGRNPSIISLLRETVDMYPHMHDFAPVFMCTHGLHDVCDPEGPGGHVPGDVVLAIHALESRMNAVAGQRVELVPDNTFDHWKPVGIYDYESVCQSIRDAGREPPEITKAGWVGNKDTHPIRMSLLSLGETHPDLLDVTDTGGWRQQGADNTLLTTERKPFVSLPDLVARYAFLIDVRGTHSSFRLKMLLFSGRPVLIQERPFLEFWSRELIPWQHYIPVAADLQDLPERVQWCLDNPEKAQAVADQAQRFADLHLTRAAAVDRLEEVFESLPLVNMFSTDAS